MRGPPETRKGALAGAPIHKDKPGRLKDENYAPRITFATAETALTGARNALLARGRLSDARKWFAHRGWQVLPKSIRGQRILRWGADHAWLAAQTDQKRKGSVRNWCRRWAPTLKDAELDQIVADTVNSNKRWSADQSATVLGITVRDRITHGFRFMGAMDDPNYEKRQAMKAEKHAARSRRYRAAHKGGANGRPKSEGPKPWEVLGKSRRSYYRQRDAKSLILNDISGTKTPCRHLIDIGSVTEFKCHEKPSPVSPLISPDLCALAGTSSSPALAASGLACLPDLDGDVFGAAPRERPSSLAIVLRKKAVPPSGGPQRAATPLGNEGAPITQSSTVVRSRTDRRVTERKDRWWVMTPDDPDHEIRRAAKAEKHAAASRAFRAARGAKPHATSLSRTKPWEALGISRNTYDRRRKRAADEGARNAQ
jgi:hypothetical protein